MVKLGYLNLESGINAIFIALIFLISCTMEQPENIIQEQFTLASEKAGSLAKENPTSTIFLLDSIVKQLSVSALSDSQLINYIGIKSEALLRLGLKDSAYAFVRSFREDLPSSNSNSVKISAGIWLAEHLIDDGKYFLANKYLDEIMILLLNNPDNKEKARALNLQGTILSFSGDYLEAQKKFLEVVRIFENMNFTQLLGPVFINLANNYQALTEKKLALEYYRKACEITLAFKDTLNYVVAFNNLGLLIQPSQPDSAEYYFTKALNLMPLNAWSVESLSTRCNLAGLYYGQKKYKESLEIYYEVLKLSRQYNIDRGIYMAMSGIGNVYEAMNKNDEALKAFQEASELAGSGGETPVQLQLFEAIRYMYEKVGNYKEAYLIHRKIKQISDSLFATEKQIAVRDLEMIYNSEKAERNNELLNAKMLLMKSQMRTNRVILVIVILFALVLGFMLYFIYRLYRQRDEAYNTLFEKYRHDVQLTGNIAAILVEESIIKKTSEKYENLIYKNLIEYFEKDKPFLNSNLKIEDVALELNTTQKNLSSVVFENSGVRFITFVNKYRVSEALKLLADSRFRNYKIEAIAREAGFGSKVSFYSAFSQITGLKPGDYREKS